MRYLFGEFVLDVEARQLQRAGTPVPLGPKGFELLELLLRSRPRALSRTRLKLALWPETHVGPTSLHVLASQVRAALGDDPQSPRWIRTVHRFGYAFRGDATEEEPEAGGPGTPVARAWVTLGERSWALREGENVLGREEGLAVRIESAGVSRHHVRIVVKAGRAILEDLGSKNGTFLRAERISGPQLLEDGDVVGLGHHVRLVFRQDAVEDRTASEVTPG